MPVVPAAARRPAPLVALCAAFALALGACSSDPVIEQSNVEEQITSVLTEEVGQAPDDVECPGDLDAEVGATIECTLTAGEDELGVTATVTEVNDGEALFDVEVEG